MRVAGIRRWAVLLAVAATLLGCGGSPVEAPTTIEDDSTDQMYSDEVTDAVLYVFTFEGSIRTVSDCQAVDITAQGDFAKDGFYRVVADVTYLNGGIAGYVDHPEVRQVKSCEAVSFDELGLPSLEDGIYGLTLIGDYADGDVLLNEYDLKAVWKDDEWAYRYDDKLELDDGRPVLVREDVEKSDVEAGVQISTILCDGYFVLPRA